MNRFPLHLQRLSLLVTLSANDDDRVIKGSGTLAHFVVNLVNSPVTTIFTFSLDNQRLALVTAIDRSKKLLLHIRCHVRDLLIVCKGFLQVRNR